MEGAHCPPGEVFGGVNNFKVILFTIASPNLMAGRDAATPNRLERLGTGDGGTEEGEVARQNLKMVSFSFFLLLTSPWFIVERRIVP
jgi:hypothetical protein